MTVVGNLNWDTNLFVRQIPKPGEEVVADKIDRVPGGKGGNVSVAAARILGRSRVALVSCLGRDETGKKQMALLQEDGVDTRAIRTVNTSESGQAYITIDDQGNDTILTHFGANALLSEEHIMTPLVQEILAGSKLIVAIDPPRQVAARILSEAKRLRKILVWHPGVLTRFGIDQWKDALDGVQYVILNEHEATAFTRTGNLHEAVSKMEENAPRTRTIVTLGRRGVAYYAGPITFQIREVDLEKIGLKVANTAGCGDAFVGAFSAYKTIGKTDEESVRYANMAAALKATSRETRGSPVRKVLEESYERYYRKATSPKT